MSDEDATRKLLLRNLSYAGEGISGHATMPVVVRPRKNESSDAFVEASFHSFASYLQSGSPVSNVNFLFLLYTWMTRKKQHVVNKFILIYPTTQLLQCM